MHTPEGPMKVERMQAMIQWLRCQAGGMAPGELGHLDAAAWPQQLVACAYSIHSPGLHATGAKARKH
jgi:hypothetical protein